MESSEPANTVQEGGPLKPANITIASEAQQGAEVDIIKPTTSAIARHNKWYWVAGLTIVFLCVVAAVGSLLRIRVANLQSASVSRAMSFTAKEQAQDIHVQLEALQLSFAGSTYPFSAELCNVEVRVSQQGITVSTLQLSKVEAISSEQCLHVSSNTNSFDSEWTLAVHQAENRFSETFSNMDSDFLIEVTASTDAYMGGLHVWNAGKQVLHSSTYDIATLVASKSSDPQAIATPSTQYEDASTRSSQFTQLLVNSLTTFTQYGVIELEGVQVHGSVLLSEDSVPRSLAVGVQPFRLVYGSLPKDSALLNMGTDTSHVLVDCTTMALTCSLPISVSTGTGDNNYTTVADIIQQVTASMMQDVSDLTVQTTLASILPDGILRDAVSSLYYVTSLSTSTQSGTPSFLQLAGNAAATCFGFAQQPDSSIFKLGITIHGGNDGGEPRRLQSLPSNVAVQISTPAITLTDSLLNAYTDITLSAASPADTLLKVVRTYLLDHAIVLSEQLSIQTKLGLSWQPVNVLTSSLATQPSISQCTAAQLRAGTCNLPVRTTPVVRSSVCGSFDLTVAPVPLSATDVRVQASFDASSIQDCLEHLASEYVRPSVVAQAGGYSDAWLFDATHLQPAQQAAINPGGTVHLTLRNRYEVVLPLVVDTRTWLVADTVTTHVLGVTDPSTVSIWNVYQGTEALAYTSTMNGTTRLHGASIGVPWQALGPEGNQCVVAGSTNEFCTIALTAMLAKYSVNSVAVTASGPCGSLASYYTAINTLPSLPSIGCASVFVASIDGAGNSQQLASGVAPRSFLPIPLQGSTFSTPLFASKVRGLAQWSAVSQTYGTRIVGSLFYLDIAFNAPLVISSAYFQGMTPLVQPIPVPTAYRYSCDPACVDYSFITSSQPVLSAFQDWTARGIAAAIQQFPPSISPARVLNNVLYAINYAADFVDDTLWDVFCPPSQVWYMPTKCRFPYADTFPNAFEWLARKIGFAVNAAVNAGYSFSNVHSLDNGTLSLHLAVSGDKCAADLLLTFVSSPEPTLYLTSNSNTALCPSTAAGLQAMYAVLQPTYAVLPPNLLVASFNLQATFHETTGGTVTSIASNALADVRAAVVAVDSGIYSVAQTALGLSPGFPTESLLSCLLLTCLGVPIVTPYAPPTSNPPENAATETNIGAVVGGAVGGILGAGVLVGLAVLGYTRVRRRRSAGAEPSQWGATSKAAPRVSRNPMALDSQM